MSSYLIRFFSYRSYLSHYDYDLNGSTTFDGVAFYTYDSENRLTGRLNMILNDNVALTMLMRPSMLKNIPH